MGALEAGLPGANTKLWPLKAGCPWVSCSRSSLVLSVLTGDPVGVRIRGGNVLALESVLTHHTRVRNSQFHHSAGIVEVKVNRI